MKLTPAMVQHLGPNINYSLLLWAVMNEAKKCRDHTKPDYIFWKKLQSLLPTSNPKIDLVGLSLLCPIDIHPALSK